MIKGLASMGMVGLAPTVMMRLVRRVMSLRFVRTRQDLVSPVISDRVLSVMSSPAILMIVGVVTRGQLVRDVIRDVAFPVIRVHV